MAGTWYLHPLTLSYDTHRPGLLAASDAWISPPSPPRCPRRGRWSSHSSRGTLLEREEMGGTVAVISAPAGISRHVIMGMRLALVLILSSCSDTEGLHTDAAGEIADVPEITDVPEDETGGEASGPCPDGITCYADHPCESRSICEGSDRAVECVSGGCEEACGTPCCSGATCEGPTGRSDFCDEGEICMERSWYESATGGVEASCRPLPSDGSTDVVDDSGWRVPSVPSNCEWGAGP